jgi:hypothetical protein
MHEWTEKDMERALQMVADGISVRRAALVNGISRSTLQGRLDGSTSRRIAQKPRQKLSEIQERQLRNWILTQADLG